MVEIKTTDIVALLEMNKKKAELEFRQTMLPQDHENQEELKDSINELKERVNSLSVKLDEAGIEIIEPNGKRIREYNEQLSEISTGDIVSAMKSRDGDAYELLAKRGEIIKQNFENRENIAKITILLTNLDQERKRTLVDSIRNGAISDRISIADWDELNRKKLAKWIKRVGIHVGIIDGFLSGDADDKIQEVRMKVSDKKIWVTNEVSELLIKNQECMNELNKKIQLKNAQRQIKDFNEDEENEFATLQQEYLSLLKERDELLREFLEEGEISFPPKE